jgi:glycosyltransferase involved in cell wall biosynthesis/DNA-binding CsgD family transcriptional regulator
MTDAAIQTKNVLIIHQNFPGQFRSIALHLWQQPNIKVIGIGKESAPGIPDFPWIKYKLNKSAFRQTHPYNFRSETAILHGHAVFCILQDLKAKGYQPDVILAHPGWGEALYVKDVFPNTRLIHLCEWYYNLSGADFGFDPEFTNGADDRLKLLTTNAYHLLNLENCDVAVSPTHWQKSQFPKSYQHKIQVAHEGIPTEHLGPDSNAYVKLPNGKTLKSGDAVITYVARNLEPYRGFHQFMRALPGLIERHPECEVVIIGGDGVSYGRPPQNAPCWRVKMLEEILQTAPAFPVERVHFLGKVPYSLYTTILKISAVHVYLSYPFVLSRSLLEAMATGCAIVASDTAPVKEVLRHGHNGLLVDFFSTNALQHAISMLLTNKSYSLSLRQKAVETARKYSHQVGLSVYMNLMFGQFRTKPSIQLSLTRQQVTLHPLARRKSDRLHELGLSPKELEVLKFLVTGMEDKDISSSLQISHKTVSQHVSSIINKLGASNRTHAIAKIFNPASLR